MTECIFCRIVSKELSAHVVFEDDTVMAFLDIQPVNPGHVLVVPKEHSASALEMEEHSLVDLFQHVRRLAPRVLSAVGTDACNITMNCGRAAGQVVFHTHVHIIPRFPTDGHKPWQREGGEMDNLPKIAENIRKAMAA